VKLRVPNYENYGRKTFSIMTASAGPRMSRVVIGATAQALKSLSGHLTRFPCLMLDLITQ
jgi:hypothetical protein